MKNLLDERINFLAVALISLAFLLSALGMRAHAETFEGTGKIDEINLIAQTVRIVDQTYRLDPGLAVSLKGQAVPVITLLEVGDSLIFTAKLVSGELVINSTAVVKGNNVLNPYTRYQEQ